MAPFAVAGRRGDALLQEKARFYSSQSGLVKSSR